MSAEPKIEPQSYTAQVTGGGVQHPHDGPAGSQPIFRTPVWVTVVRGFQAFFAFIIMVLAGLLIHGLVMDEPVFGLVCGLFTLIVVAYVLISEKVTSCHTAYNYWAHLSLDFVLAIFWLASMGANAARRGRFTVDVKADCWSDGSTVNSGHCNIYGRADGSLEKRVAVATKAGLAYMSAIAGLSALVMILFIATTVYLGHQVRLHLQAKKKSATGDNGQVEMNAQQAQPMLNQQYPPQQQQQQQQQPAAYPQYAEQNTGYASQVYPQQPPQQQQAPYNSYDYAQSQQQPQQYTQYPPQTTVSPPPPEQKHQQQYPQPSVSPAPEYQHPQQQQQPYTYPQQTQPYGQQQQQNQQQELYVSPSATPVPHHQQQQEMYRPPQ